MIDIYYTNIFQTLKKYNKSMYFEDEYMKIKYKNKQKIDKIWTKYAPNV